MKKKLMKICDWFLSKKYWNPIVWIVIICFIPYYLVFGGLKAYYIDAKEIILRELNW